MRPHHHPNNNAVLAPPPGATSEQCVPLPITRVLMGPALEDGVVSYWMPNEAELALLACGMPLRLIVWGVTHPPLHVGVDRDAVL